MRDIRFRLWKNDTMFYSDDDRYISFYEFFEQPAMDREDECMQYTEIKDVNGRHIYEGDIVMSCDVSMGEVIFEDGMFLVNGVDGLGYSMNQDGVLWHKLGNIHENPGLVRMMLDK